MADLDADLYGDLYGNDETDFNEQDDKEPQSATEPTSSDAFATKSEPIETYTTPDHRPSVSSSTALSSSTIPKSEPQTASAAPVTQQIPTYEQPQPTDYRESSANAGGYSNIPTAERSIRPSEMKDEGKMFIGGLNWDTTDDALREYFEQFGKVDACTIMRDAAGRSRCFAFLTFEEPASVNAVMVREHVLDGKIIDPKRAIPRQEHQRATKLFIGGLAGSVTSDSMREFFSQFGKVIDSTVMLDRETGRSKGFGFVSFEDTNVQPFLGFGNLEIDGKMIDVKLAQPRYQRDNYQEGQGQDDFNQGGRGGNFGGQQGGNFNNQQQMTQNAAGGGNASFDPQALAQLYTRMFQMTGAGAMGGGMMGGMRPGMGMGMGPGMGMGMGMGGMGMGGMGGMGMGMGMGRGGPGMMQGGGMNPNIPRGPRGAPGGPAGAVGGNAGVGPQRAGQRGQHNYHPYAR
ncbi:hypothetical protein HGRIS_009031 [Hohenbuehelia grisea]|uniref:RRM domain-containing protein n=1 Tax=Hohenbuehelia grisea TaxID=104357 RepID=A0ABR3IZW8_9AGAR